MTYATSKATITRLYRLPPPRLRPLTRLETIQEIKRLRRQEVLMRLAVINARGAVTLAYGPRDGESR